MTTDETLKLVAVASANYSYMQDKDLSIIAELWQETLADIPFDIAKSAIIKIISTNKFFPTVADIREAVYYILNPNQLTALEAWNKASKAIAMYGSYNPKDAYKAMGDDVAEVVRMFGYNDLCENGGEVTRAHFFKMWNERMERKKEFGVLPQSLQKQIMQISGKDKHLRLVGN